MESTVQKCDSITNLTKAVIQVMIAVKGIDKTANVGVGNNGYKGVADQEVKKIIGDAMEKNGLAIFPIGIEESCEVAEWEESYNGQAKRKQQIFVKAKTTYLLAHESGEFIQIVGYGHGIDSQDKAPGKATTYALKYALLYTFMVATGKIDDADSTHSDDIPVAANQRRSSAPANTATAPFPSDNRQMTTLEMAMYDISKAKTLADLKTIWENYQSIQDDSEFKREVNRAKAKLTPST